MIHTIRLSAAEAAKRIRKELHTAFPGVKFSVRSERFSLGSAVSVRYTDGPALTEVEALVATYGGRGYDSGAEVTLYNEGALRLTANGLVVYSTGAFLDVVRNYSEWGLASIAELLRRDASKVDSHEAATYGLMSDVCLAGEPAYGGRCGQPGCVCDPAEAAH